MQLWKALIVIPALNFATAKSFGAAPSCNEVFAKQEGPKKLSPLFKPETGIVELELTGDFNKVYKAAEGGNWTGEDRIDPKYFSTGTLRDLSQPNSILAVSFRARGMSSLNEGEASFPKLKIEIPKTIHIDGTLFDGSRNFRINTHVNTHPEAGLTPGGRLNSENSPWREGLAYALAQKLGLLTPAVKLARIQYVDSVTKESFKRQALLIETDKKLAERIEGTILDYGAVAQDTPSPVNSFEAAKMFLFHRMIGNDDVNLRVHEKDVPSTERYRPMFNTFVVNTPTQKGRPVVYDLDLSSFMSGMNRFNAHFSNSDFNLKDAPEVLLANSLAALRQKFTTPELAAGIAEMKAKKSDLYKLVDESPTDKDGKSIARAHLDLFFKLIDEVMSYEVLNSENLLFYNDAKKTKNKLSLDKITEEPGTLRPGTPIRVLAREGKMLKVAILDANVDLAEGEGHIGYIDASAKIAKTLDAQFIGRVDYRDMMW